MLKNEQINRKNIVSKLLLIKYLSTIANGKKLHKITHRPISIVIFYLVNFIVVNNYKPGLIKKCNLLLGRSLVAT